MSNPAAMLQCALFLALLLLAASQNQLVDFDDIDAVSCCADVVGPSCGGNLTNWLNDIKAQTMQLQTLAQKAQSLGHDVRLENLTMEVSKLFQAYIPHDATEAKVLCSMYWDKYGTPASCDTGRDLACREAADLSEVLAHAVDNIRPFTDPTSNLKRPAVPSFYGGRDLLPGADGYFYAPSDINQSMPALQGGYDQGVWEFFYGYPDPVMFEQAKLMGQSSLELSTGLDQLISSETEDLNMTVVHELMTGWQQGNHSNMLVGIVFRHRIADWMVAKYPELAKYGSGSIHYNIDHPVVGKWWKTAIDGLMGAFGKANMKMHYRLDNEASVPLIGNDTEISSYTFSAWSDWLATEFGSVASMNSVWNTSFMSFTDTPWPVIHDETGKMHPDTKLEGTGWWFSFQEFGMHRSYRFYRMLADLVHSHDPKAATHIKFVNERTFGTFWRFGGLDRNKLNDMTEWVGADTRATTGHMHSGIPSLNHTNTLFALDWIPICIGYTYMRTTHPYKVTVDLEVHPISLSSFTNGSIPYNHLSVTFVLAHLHGLAFHEIWNWSRFGNGSASDGLVDTMLTQPKTLDSYSRVLAVLNALGREIRVMANSPHPVCILISDISTMQDKRYNPQLVDVFEALEYSGQPPAFVTEIHLNTTLSNCEVLVVPVAEFVLNQSIPLLHSMAEKMLIIGNDASKSFSKDQYGRIRDMAEIEWVGSVPTIPSLQPMDLLAAMGSHLAAHVTSKQFARCLAPTNEVAEYGSNVYGLICRSAVDPLSKNLLVAIVNILTIPVTAMIEAPGYQPMGVSLTDGSTVNISDPITFISMEAFAFKLPSK